MKDMTEPAQTPSAQSGFHGLRVLSLESRRSEELARLIRNSGGDPILAPSMREVPLKDNHEALHLASELIAGRIDVLILLTGTGTRVLLRVVQDAHGEQYPEFIAALKSVPTVTRGPKAVAALAQSGVRATITAPEPNTWREVLHALDEKSSVVPLDGRTVAVQEYGTSNQELLAGLAERGARVMRVPVYDWQLPEDVGPLRAGIRKLAGGEVDVVLFTTSVQVRHLMQVAGEMDLADAVRRACSRVVVGSIGPVTSEELRREQFPVDLEPSHPRMGFLVNELAEQSGDILARKLKPEG
jgi:uroporphyrinogen-III synthase